MKSASNDHQHRVYLNHIKRLEETNKELSLCLVAERQLRRKAYKWYENRLLSKWWLLMDGMLIMWRTK